jgi:uncharacterized protein
VERDRDEHGRARNARPRDSLGRPLPYGMTGVDRPAADPSRGAEETFELAQRLIDAGQPFHAHEVFEDAWKAAADGDRILWRGLAQLSAGLTQVMRGNPTGGGRLITRGADTMRDLDPAAAHGLDLAALLHWADETPRSPMPRLRN